MGRRLLIVCSCALVWCGAAHADPWTKSDQKLTMSDGVQLATTLYEPATAPPVGGFPAIMMFHGLGGTRTSMNTIAELTFATQGYAVLTFDLRGHGQSGGLFDLDGPRDVQDVSELLGWLGTHKEIDVGRVGAWGVSLGGGVVWAALKAGLPFAAAEVNITWTDLYQALAPRNLVKSGAILASLNSVPADRQSPEIGALQANALNGRNMDALHAFADSRSVLDSLRQITTPVEIFQARRDFTFGLDQGVKAYTELAGPKRLFIGDFGHPPSTYPGPDAVALFTQAATWFDRWLKGVGTIGAGVEVSPDPWRGTTVSYAKLPALATVRTKAVKIAKTFGAHGKVVTTLALPDRRLETFGACVVTVTASTKTQAKQLVAVLEAVKGNASTLVSEGGTQLPTASKAWTVSFPLVSDATSIVKGSRLRLTLSWTSTAQDPGNLLYLTGVPDGSSLTVKSAYVTLPVLKRPISR